MATPAWIGASTGSLPLASQVNQFLGTHPATMVYKGAEKDNQSTAGSGSTASNGLYIAQSFTAGSAYTTGRLVLTLAVTGAPAPLTISIQANSAGAPSGTALLSVALPAGFVTGSATAITMPLPGVALSNGTTYWIVANAVGNVSNLYSWSKGNQVTGTSTSTNGTAWTTQAYGSLFQVWDNTVVQPLTHTWEDSGARWTGFTWTARNLPSVLDEYTVAQAANDYVQSVRTFSYSNSALTGVA